MDRIDTVLGRLKQEQKMAFIGFPTVGDLDILTYVEYMKQLEQNGYDIIEIRIPFSDPVAEGPVIQEASLHALQNDIATETVIHMMLNIREFPRIPLIFLLYYNQIFKYRVSRLLRESEAAGIDALIIPNLPTEYHEELKPLVDTHHVQLIFLATPVSSVRRKNTTEQSEDFLYCVTSPGTTGKRTKFQADLKVFLNEFSAYGDTPKALDFDISTPQQITEMKPYANGMIVGNATVRQIGRLAKQEITLEEIGSFMKTSVDAAHAQKGTIHPLFVLTATSVSPLLQMHLLYQLPSPAHVNRRLLYPVVMIYQLSTNRIHAEVEIHNLFPLYGGIPFALK